MSPPVDAATLLEQSRVVHPENGPLHLWLQNLQDMIAAHPELSDQQGLDLELSLFASAVSRLVATVGLRMKAADPQVAFDVVRAELGRALADETGSLLALIAPADRLAATRSVVRALSSAANGAPLAETFFKPRAH